MIKKKINAHCRNPSKPVLQCVKGGRKDGPRRETVYSPDGYIYCTTGLMKTAKGSASLMSALLKNTYRNGNITCKVIRALYKYEPALYIKGSFY